MTALELIQTARRLFHKEQLFQISSMRAVGAQVDDALVCTWGSSQTSDFSFPCAAGWIP